MNKFNLFSLIAGTIIYANTIIIAQVWDATRGCIVDVNEKCLPSTVQSALPFLRINADSRSGGMADMGVSTSPDANSLQFNASKLAFAEKDFDLALSYTPWLRNLGLTDVFLSYAGGHYKIDELSSLGFGLKLFSLGEITYTTIDAQSSGTGKPREVAIEAAYARKLSEKISMGVTARYVNSNLADGQKVDQGDVTSANVFSADLSWTYLNTSDQGSTQIGASITNIGSKVSYTNNKDKEYIPTNLGLGATITRQINDYNSLSFSLELNKLLVPSLYPSTHPDYDKNNNGTADYREKSTFGAILGSLSDAPGGFKEELKEWSVGLGGEYWYNKQFAVRAGYFYENGLKGDRKYLTAGLGLKYNVYGFDVSYLIPTNSQKSALDNTLRFTFSFDLGNKNSGR